MHTCMYVYLDLFPCIVFAYSSIRVLCGMSCTQLQGLGFLAQLSYNASNFATLKRAGVHAIARDAIDRLPSLALGRITSDVALSPLVLPLLPVTSTNIHWS